MKGLIVYDSMYGNTEKIAQAIGEALGKSEEVVILRVGEVKGVKVTAFVPHLTEEWIKKTPVLAFFVKLFGRSVYAAKHIADKLQKRGGTLIAPPEGFYVEDTEGPLVPGELERASSWAKNIVIAYSEQ